MKELNHFPHLENFIMKNAKLNVPNKFSSKTKIVLPKLKTLDLSGSFEDFANIFVTEHLGHFEIPKITCLKFDNNGLTQFGLTAILGHQNMKNLKILSVTNNKIKRIDGPIKENE